MFKWSRTGLIVSALLFVPTKSIFFELIGSLGILSMTLSHLRLRNQYFAFVITMALLIVFGACVRFFSSADPNGRDVLELGRLIPVLLIFACLGFWKMLTFQSLAKASFLYLLVDLVVSLAQSRGHSLFGLMSVVKRFYSSPHHVEGALEISKRALGLSAGPGQHGAMMVLIYAVMLGGLLATQGSRLFYCAGVAICLFVVLLTQSQTALVVVTLTSVMAVGIAFRHGSRNLRIMIGIGLSVLLALVGNLIVYISSNYSYLATLLTQGIYRSAYQKRIEKWKEILDIAWQHPSGFIFGWGKEVFGALSSAFDNEWLYVSLVYGPIVFSALIVVTSLFLWRATRDVFLRSRALTPFETSLYLVVPSGLLFAWPGAFFTQITIACMVSILVASRHWEKINGQSRQT